jgi:flavin reductase (DIM6/NTAB) family NADH-FMN oxidoreductase RutF
MQKHITSEAISSMEKLYRINLINSLSGFKSVSLVGTKNNQNQTNLTIISSLVHIGSNPALFGMIFRPGIVDRHSLENILETKYYTVNHINEVIYKQAHQTSARYPREISEFEATGLEQEYKNNFFAPFVKESHIQFGLEFKQKIDIEINNTILIIGEVKDIYLPNNCLLDDGFIDIEIGKSITCSGLDSYHSTKKINRLSYAKPDKELTSRATM